MKVTRREQKREFKFEAVHLYKNQEKEGVVVMMRSSSRSQNQCESLYKHSIMQFIPFISHTAAAFDDIEGVRWILSD